MSCKKLIPDFNAIGKTDWAKPSFCVKGDANLGSTVGALLMVLFGLFPWCVATVLVDGMLISESSLGITTWYGALGFVMALVAVVGVFYKHYSLALWASLLGIVFGILGAALVPGLSLEDVQAMNTLKQMGGFFGIISTSHPGAYLYILASMVVAAGSYIKAIEE